MGRRHRNILKRPGNGPDRPVRLADEILGFNSAMLLPGLSPITVRAGWPGELRCFPLQAPSGSTTVKAIRGDSLRPQRERKERAARGEGDILFAVDLIRHRSHGDVAASGHFP